MIYCLFYKQRNMAENENQIKEEEELKELVNLSSNIFYLNNTIKDFELPLSLDEFRTQIKDLFHIEEKSNDEIFLLYTYLEKNENDDKEKETILEAKTDNDYRLLLKRIKAEEIKDETILIETDKLPSQISRKSPETFEEEIQYVIETELKAAAENIKKYLSGNKKCYPSVKNRKNKICSTCCRNIKGDIYKSVTDIEEKIYCEKCSFNQKDPTFIIH